MLSKSVFVILTFCLLFDASNSQLQFDEIDEIEASSYPSNSLNTVVLLDHNYFFSDFNLTWFDALLFCKSYGMDLANIDTLQENTAVRNHILSLGLQLNSGGTAGVYTSGHRMGRDSWSWANGATISWYESWCSGNPNPSGTDMCLEYYLQGGDTCFNDISCVYSYGRYFICEENL